MEILKKQNFRGVKVFINDHIGDLLVKSLTKTKKNNLGGNFMT